MHSRNLTMFGALLSAIALAEAGAIGTPNDTRCSDHEPTGVWADGIESQRRANLGNGSFLNPVLAGDHADPSILKDGEDYYLTHSSFFRYPGLLIWHSKNLVDWQPVGPALKTNVGDVWAPDLVKHNGRYYIYFPALKDNRGSNFVVWADKIEGPWTSKTRRTHITAM